MNPYQKTLEEPAKPDEAENNDFIPYGDYLGLTKEQYEARIDFLHQQAKELKQNVTT